MKRSESPKSSARREEPGGARSVPPTSVPVGKPASAASDKKPSARHRFYDACKIGFGICLVLGSAGATAFAGYEFAVSSPRFAVQKLEVSTSRRMSDEAVARAAGVEPGTNLFAIDLDAAERRLLDDPWVRSARLTRKLPDTLRIDLQEREAAALIAIESEVLLVDSAGEPFKRWAAGDPHDLPVITGIAVETIAKDRSQATIATATALEVLEHYGRLPVSKAHAAQEVHLAPDGTVTLTVGVRGIALHLGHGPWPKKLLMVAEVLKTFERRQGLPGVVFLDNELHPERVVVRMR